MGSTIRIGRLGMLAVWLGAAAAVTATAGTASATTDIDISIDGFDIFNGGGSAHASSGLGDLAIAIGPNSGAVAEGGFGDFASAFSTGTFGADALAGDPLAGATGNNFDFASAIGNFSIAAAGNGGFPDTIGSSFDFASALGGNGPTAASNALAGDNGSGDSATAVGQGVVSDAGGSLNAAQPANFDSASVLGNLFTPTSTASVAAAGGSIMAPGGSSDLAFIDDPFGTVGSDATAGLGHNFDLAGVLGDNFTATSTAMDFLFHIAPFF